MQTAARRSFDYDMPLIQTPTSACQIRQAWAKVADTLDHETAGRLKDEIKALLKEKNAVLVAHYYVDPLIQDLALETGGCVGDSLEMARNTKPIHWWWRACVSWARARKSSALKKRC